MTENNPDLNPENIVEKTRKEFEVFREKIETSTPTAVELRSIMQGAIPLFELGLKLGKETSPEAIALTEEIRKYITYREKQLSEQLHSTNQKMGG